ncbi:hypothetical protein AB0F72_05345 [Actinoplanes sp. NPDC023936]|uniref:hypothetical protein n=1 Tax=Actinoplanes sp. NPDC023936 TaxID=3154910 RepID=UPI0034074503
MTEEWQPESPHLVIGLFLDRLTDADALERTCAALRGLGAEPAGGAWLGPAEPEPFEYVSELPLMSSTWPTAEPSLRPYRIGMVTSDLGRLAVTFDRGDPAGGHPVTVLLHAGLYDIPPLAWDDDDRAEDPRFRSRVAVLFQGLCEQLDPAYGVVGWDLLPTVVPSVLAGGEESFPEDFYVSRRLGSLPGEVAKLFPRPLTFDGPTGLFVSHWLRPEEPVSPSRQAVDAASAAVGRVLIEAGWRERR